MPELDKEPCQTPITYNSRPDFSAWLTQEALWAADHDDKWEKQCKDDIEEARPKFFTGGWVIGDPGMGKSVGRDYVQMFGRSVRKPDIVDFKFSLDAPRSDKKRKKKGKKHMKGKN